MNEIELLKKRLAREQQARKEAERILEAKALELYQANESLKRLNESLEDQIYERTLALQESEAKFRNVIDQATDIIYTTDEEGYFTFINPIGSNAFGYSMEEIIGKRYIDFIPDEYKKELFAYYTKIRDQGSSNDYYELPIRAKSGETFWIGQNVNRIERLDGNFYYNAVARDITLRIRAESELEKARVALTQSEVKYRSVLENLDLGLMEVDNDGKIIRVYDRFCVMTGYTQEELIGRDALNTLIVPEFEKVLRTQDANRQKKESGVYEVQIRRKDGKRIWVLISGAPFYNENGDVIGSLGIHFDITDRKDLESNLKVANQKAIKAQKAEQDFLANMSHEIRTPLNAIIGMSHLLQDTQLDDKQDEYVEILSDSASLLKGLVSDILDISKIDSGKAEMNESTFELTDFANRLVKTFDQRAQEKGLRLSSSVTCDQRCIVKSDHQWLNQILINLLGNAIKFTQSGEVNLTIRLVKENEQSAQYHFEVQDTGIGMDPSERKKIFTSFKQANTNVRKEYGGTGLGLSIASRLVSLLGGELEVSTEEGVGSRFFFTLNLTTSKESLSRNSKIEDFAIERNADINILVVEDNIMNQKYISALLHKWKVNFEIAENGQQAVDKCSMYTYDMIFMDLSMPVMDGYTATNLIREMPGNHAPIIALTASTFLSKKELAMNAGMNDFLAKPFTPRELYRVIQKHVPPSDRTMNSGADDTPTINRTTLSSLYGDDDEYALDMFQTYADVIDQEVGHLKEHRHDKEAIRKQIHKMKPMFAMVGLDHISQLCAEIETNSTSMHLQDIITAADKVIMLVEQSRSTIIDEISRLNEKLK